jgi:phosphoenolpyruvate synthase/pyruvate phosphate dikinase
VIYVHPLYGREAQPAEIVGGKAVGLALLAGQDIRVPPGFAVSTRAYCDFVAETELLSAIRELVEGAETFREQAQASARIRGLFEAGDLPDRLCEELDRAYAELGDGEQLAVAVRSSALGEDAAEASLAGRHESYLWIRGAEELARAVLRCWASLFSARAIASLRRTKLGVDETAMGVVVQVMVPAEAAGVMFTIDPVTGDPSQIAIEGSIGLGPTVVAGEVTPDRFCVDKVTLEIRTRTLARKHVARRVGADALVAVPPAEQDRACVTDAEAVELAAIGRRIERALGMPQDVEWAIGSAAREIVVLQTRRETVWSRR